MQIKKRATSFTRWELFGCALHGHETYQPISSEQAEKLSKTLSSMTPQGIAWRCLRCGNFIPGKPRYRSSIAHTPLVLRGKVLRQAFILRLLATERGIRGIFLLLLGYAILRFKSRQGSLQHLLDTNLPTLHTLAHTIGYNLDSSETLHVIREVLGLGQHTLTLAAFGTFAYAALQLIESVGLWRMKRWGEYFSAVATSLFIPLEGYELSHHVTAFKAATLIVNIAAVIYLLVTKRLFGIRSGRKAYDKEMAGANLLEIVASSNEND